LAENINVIKNNGDAIKEESVTFRKNEKSRGAPKKKRETMKCFRNDSGSRSEGKETKKTAQKSKSYLSTYRMTSLEKQKMKMADLKGKQKE